MGYTMHSDIKAKSVSYGNKRKMSDVDYIVIHYTGNRTDKAVNNAKYYRDTNTRSAGAHYFVDQTSVYKSIDVSRIAWSVGGDKYTNCAKTGGGKMYKKITNANSISIEMCSVEGKIADRTVTNVVALCRKLMKKYGIPASNVYRHFDVTGKPCPGWDGWIGDSHKIWDNFKSDLKNTGTLSKANGTWFRTKNGGHISKLKNGATFTILERNATKMAIKNKEYTMAKVKVGLREGYVIQKYIK